MTATVDNAVADLQRANAELQRQLDDRTAQLDEALARETATAEVLGVINSAPGDLAPVFQAIVEKAHALCDAAYGSLQLWDGEKFRGVAMRGFSDPMVEALRRGYSPSDMPCQRLIEGESIAHCVDLAEIDSPTAQLGGVALAGIRTILYVALRKDDVLLGQIVAARQEVRPFSDKEIALVENFAAQAVIAMENARLITETREALDQQTATAEVLGVINSSPGDLAPVFEVMVERAAHLCEADEAAVRTFDGGLLHLVTTHGTDPLVLERLRRLGPTTLSGLYEPFSRGDEVVHYLDARDTDAYRNHKAGRQRIDARGIRSWLAVALRKEGTLLGIINVHRRDVRPFTDKQIALLQNFAAQAVIAIENARLLTETREALEQQTATAEVLQVINSSPGELAPVFDAILEKAHALCDASRGTLFLFDGEVFRAAASQGYPGGPPERMRLGIAVSEDPRLAALLAGERLIHIPDLGQLDDPIARAVAERGGVRTNLLLPLRKDRNLLGVLSCNRQEVRPFTEKQIALLENFAAQAVIAMENARLITETQEALDQQTATSEVLGVINSSPGELAPVFDAMLERARGLCGAAFGTFMLRDGERFSAAAVHGAVPEHFAAIVRQGFVPSPSSPIGRLRNGEPFVHIPDLAEVASQISDDPVPRAAVEFGGIRTLLMVPLIKDGQLLGVFTNFRQEVRPFTDKQIALLQNFAAQAVIAMENARLITETREALEQQTATAEVLGVINSSPGDLAPVFDAMLEKAMRLCTAAFGYLLAYDGERFQTAAHHGLPARFADYLPRMDQPGPTGAYARILDGAPLVHVNDLMNGEVYQTSPLRRALVDLGGARTGLIVALRKEEALLGIFTIYRQEVRSFSDKEITLLQNFAAQAVIAMENARLITETREARDDAEAALRDLKAAQANLIQAEKMASLGQLTAGIAHEIKNPLNFVNNFASLSVELLDELKETAAPALATLDSDERADVDETMVMLTGNLEKIAEHGKRADNIVKSMLEHSRGVSGERREIDLNWVIEEALNLAYHGARAQDQSFNITLERDYARSLKPIEVAPQEMTRVFLNLIGNGFYATTKRARENGEGSYRPTLTIATSDAGDTVEVRVRDNGTGIPPEIKDKLFQPFFTTKPTGEGTGLGLSISYDIVTQQHGGTITVESEPGVFTEFTIRLPRQ